MQVNDQTLIVVNDNDGLVFENIDKIMESQQNNKSGYLKQNERVKSDLLFEMISELDENFQSKYFGINFLDEDWYSVYVD